MKNTRYLFGLLFVIAIFVWIGFFVSSSADSSNNLKIYFLNVGQGDSEYIKMPDGEDILIDGGPDKSVLQELGKVMSVGDRQINLVVLTHPHADHLDGLVDILKRYQVDEVWQSGVNYPSAAYDEFKNIIAQENIKNDYVKAGDERNFGQIKFLVLYPLSNLQNQNFDNINNASIVNRLEYNKFSALFLGDAEKSAQQNLVNSAQRTNVVKIAHHGSSDSINENYLNIVRPEISIIEVGANNKFGHPAKATIDYLTRLASQIYRTDQDGNIEIESDGNNYWKK